MQGFAEVRNALERLLNDGPIDGSIREGAELVGAMRAPVEQVRIGFRTKTELEVRI